MNENDRSQLIFSVREACDYLRAIELGNYPLAYQRKRAGQMRTALDTVLAQLDNEAEVEMGEVLKEAISLLKKAEDQRSKEPLPTRRVLEL